MDDSDLETGNWRPRVALVLGGDAGSGRCGPHHSRHSTAPDCRQSSSVLQSRQRHVRHQTTTPNSAKTIHQVMTPHQHSNTRLGQQDLCAIHTEHPADLQHPTQLSGLSWSVRQSHRGMLALARQIILSSSRLQEALSSARFRVLKLRGGCLHQLRCRSSPGRPLRCGLGKPGHSP